MCTSEDDAARSSREVLQSHLAYRKQGNLDADLRDNDANDVLLISAEGINYGHGGVRRLASILRRYTPSDGYSYGDLLVEGDLGQLAWSATGPDIAIHDGADIFIVRDGRIVAQPSTTRRAATECLSRVVRSTWAAGSTERRQIIGFRRIRRGHR